MTANEKRVEKLTAKVERLEGTNNRLKDKIADLKAKRSVKAKAGASARTAARTAPKRRKSRSSQPAQSATA